MQFSDIVDLIDKLNSNRENINVGHYFSFDANYIYCFLVKSINYDQSNFYEDSFQGYPYFCQENALNIGPSNHVVLNWTIAEEYDMRILRRIKLKKKNGKVIDLISTLKELINFCKNLKVSGDRLFSDEFCDKITEDFLGKMTNQDILECL